MKIDHLKGGVIFLGTRDQAKQIYKMMIAKGLTDIQKWALLYYLGLPISDKLKAVHDRTEKRIVQQACSTIYRKFPEEVND
ncbi:hypothetical protein ACFL3E_02325 [Patescibacteria group bacterium]